MKSTLHVLFNVYVGIVVQGLTQNNVISDCLLWLNKWSYNKNIFQMSMAMVIIFINYIKKKFFSIIITSS